MTPRLLLTLAALAALPALAAPSKPVPKSALKLPPFLSFGRGNTHLPKGSDATVHKVKEYLDAHPEVTLLRVEGHRDAADNSAQAEAHATARAWVVGEALVKAGVDCKRLIAVGQVKGGYMKEGGAYATFVNAALKGKPIGGAPVDGRGSVAGDLCKGARADKAGKADGKQQAQHDAKPDKGASQAKGGSLPSTGKPSEVCGAAGLSAIRQKMFKALDEVIPSIQGVKKSGGRNLFDGTKQMTQAEYDEKKKNHVPIVTTCGLLPGVMLKDLGLKGPLTASGTEGLRLCAQGLGKPVFVENDGTKLPKPGDLYWLRYPKTPNLDSVAHVGVICRPGDESWLTLDAGQGAATRQEAQIVTRKMKKVDGTHPFLSGPGYVGDAADLRRVGGWIDLDALFEAQQRASQVKLVVKGNSATCK